MKRSLLLREAVRIIKSRNPFSITYVAHGDNNAKRKRKGGYFVHIDNAVMTSFFYDRYSINIKSTDSDEIRECKCILIVELNGHKVIY